MDEKRHTLLNHWTLVMHNSYKLYANDNDYVVFDGNQDMLVGLMVHEDVVEVYRSSWDLKYYLDIHKKEIVITNKPMEE